MTVSDFAACLEAAGHVLRRDSRGEIDWFYMEDGHHNGPGCMKCGESWCEHCASDRDNITPCGEPPV